MQQARDTSMTKIVSCKSNLQIDYKYVFREGKMLCEFETGFGTLCNMLAKQGYQTQSVKA